MSASVHPPPSMGLNNHKFGMWAFIASDVPFFAVLIANFLFLGKMDPPGTFEHAAIGRELLNIPLTALNTFLLLTSSYTVVIALEALKHNEQFKFRTALIITGLFGTLFVGVQAFEYYQLIALEGLDMTSLFGASFFTLTGFHGAHVVGGLIWLFFIIIKSFGVEGGFAPADSVKIEVFGLYWHFVDIVWLLLFSLVYLI